MLPLLLFDVNDVTARVAAEQGVQAGITDVGASAALTSGEATLEARTLGPERSAGLHARGLYGRIWSFSRGAGAPTDTFSAELSGDAGLHVAPRLHLSFSTQSYLANRFGVRATDALAARDPFLFGPRLEYTTGGELGLYSTLSPRAVVHVTGGYTQAGGLAAAQPEAVGVDTHAPRVGLGLAYELGPRDMVTPEIRYSYTHFYHALYDVNLHRGPADVHAVTATMGEARAFSRRLQGTAAVGATVATPPPILASRTLTASPEARLGLTYLTPRARLTASYTYGYTTLGPRIGAGNQHTFTAEITLRPLDGAVHRDLLFHGVLNASYGRAPIAQSPPLNTTPTPMTLPLGTLTTATLAAGGRLEVPIRRGLAALGGVDVELMRGIFDPAPPGGQTGTQLLTVVMVGIAGTLSTDPARTVRRDPEEEEDEARRRDIGKIPQESPGEGVPVPLPAP